VKRSSIIMQTVALVACVVFFAPSAWAQERLKLAVGQRGNWDTSIAEIGNQLGIFKKHDLELEILYTQGGGETQQAVLSGSVDIGVAAGIMGALGAYSKGAPLRSIGAETTGAGDLYWYVKADSPIHSIHDINGKSIAYSTNGSSTHGVVNALLKENNLTAKPTATGSPATTLTMVMSSQIDVGWAAPPFGLDLLDSKAIRTVASGNDTVAFRDQTVRLLLTNVQTLTNRKAVVIRFMQAYRETIEAMYQDPKALAAYAKFVGIPESLALRARDQFFPKSALDPDKIVGLDAIIKDAVTLKYTAQPLSEQQVADFFQLQKSD
jgi:NitT/TauT family transport system substrate-binding protein